MIQEAWAGARIQEVWQGLQSVLGEVWLAVHWMLGLDVQTLTLWQMASRALIVYAAALLMVRLPSSKRFLGKHATFDVIFGIIFGSVLSRALSASEPFFETLETGFLLVSLHWLLAIIAFHSHRFAMLVKGNELTLIQDGEIQWDSLHQSQISKMDLTEALRANAKLCEPSEVKVARLERSGDISVIPRAHEPQVIEIMVEAGVQTVRIKLE
jgi:uncharacterized membrane protein YcaP (DUF421 family)